MFNISLANLHETHPGLTQAYYLRSSESLTVTRATHGTSDTRTQPFSGILMASATADRFYQVGQGDLDAAAYTRIIEQYAYASGLEFTAVAAEFDQYLLVASKDVALWTKILTSVIGVTGKNIRKNMAIKILPAHIHEVVMKSLPSVHAPFPLLIADFVAGLLAPLGWVVTGQGFAYHVTRRYTFPRARDLVDAARAHALQGTINIMATAKLGVFGELMKGDAVSVVPLAQALANAMASASDHAQQALDPYRVVKSVMTRLVRIWDPVCPKELFPTERVMRTAGFEECRTNLSLFLIAQDMLNGSSSEEGVDWFASEVGYTDEEFSAYVMKTFYDSIMVGSVYHARRLDEAVASVGSATACDAHKHPIHMAVYEALKPEAEVSVFKPVTPGSDYGIKSLRYLMIDSDLSSKYTDSFKSALNQFNLPTLVRSRMESYESVAASLKLADPSLLLSLLFPSVMERETAAGRPFAALRAAVAGASDSDIAGLLFGEVDLELIAATGENGARLSEDEKVRAVRRRMFDMYAQICAVAVSSAAPMISSVDLGNGRPMLFLSWMLNTPLKRSLGNSIVMGSTVDTTEPLEAIAYVRGCETREPSVERAVQSPMLHLHQDALHMWPWHSSSTSIKYAQSYVTHLGEEDYTVELSERDFLGLFTEKKGVRFLKPVVARASVVSWMELWMEDIAYLEGILASTKDELVQAAVEGRLLQVKVEVLNKLVSLAQSGVGRRVMAKIDMALRDQMYKTSTLDEYSAHHTVAHRLKLSVLTGLWVVEMLGLAASEEIGALFAKVNDPRVLHLALAILQGQK